jgi:aminoglycoside/choline kinase family phosphotransferase
MTLHAAALRPPGSPDPRLDLLTAWLGGRASRHGLDLATLAPASSDASFRRYFRLAASTQQGGTAIAVDAPPPEKCREFVQVAQLLADAGVHVPAVLEVDFAAGFMLVTDLGTRS